MTTDDERRDVAARLRDSIPADLHLGRGNKAWGLLYLTLFGRYMPNQASGRTYKQVAELLADLIDPDSGHVAQAVEREAGAVTCDRDALLKLAKNLDAQAECRIKSNDIITRRGDRSRNTAVAKDFFGIAREIRNALGIDDGA